MRLSFKDAICVFFGAMVVIPALAVWLAAPYLPHPDEVAKAQQTLRK